MEHLRMETFLEGPADPESRQYRVLQGLKECHKAFDRTHLYPALSDLIQLHRQLTSFLQQSDEMQKSFPQHLKEVDTEDRKLVYESDSADASGLTLVIDLIRWALPHIETAIGEGTQIYAFVEGHVSIERVGLLPMYRDEGYWFVPEPARSMLHLMRYEVSLYTSSAGRYRMLKTRLLESMDQGSVARSPEAIKLALMERFRDLPNPATYTCEVDLALPYAETVLPVAKRKLMQQLAA